MKPRQWSAVHTSPRYHPEAVCFGAGLRLGDLTGWRTEAWTPHLSCGRCWMAWFGDLAWSHKVGWWMLVNFWVGFLPQTAVEKHPLEPLAPPATRVRICGFSASLKNPPAYIAEKLLGELRQPSHLHWQKARPQNPSGGKTAKLSQKQTQCLFSCCCTGMRRVNYYIQKLWLQTLQIVLPIRDLQSGRDLQIHRECSGIWYKIQMAIWTRQYGRLRLL